MISSYPDLSVVVPMLNAQDKVDALYHAISSVVSTLPNVSQIVFVDDRSTDKTWEAITRLAEQDSTLIGLRLAANVGQTVQRWPALRKADWITSVAAAVRATVHSFVASDPAPITLDCGRLGFRFKTLGAASAPLPMN